MTTGFGTEGCSYFFTWNVSLFSSDRDGYGGGRDPRGYMDRPSGGSYRDSYDGYGKMQFHRPTIDQKGSQHWVNRIPKLIRPPPSKSYKNQQIHTSKDFPDQRTNLKLIVGSYKSEFVPEFKSMAMSTQKRTTQCDLQSFLLQGAFKCLGSISCLLAVALQSTPSRSNHQKASSLKTNLPFTWNLKWKMASQISGMLKWATALTFFLLCLDMRCTYQLKLSMLNWIYNSRGGITHGI